MGSDAKLSWSFGAAVPQELKPGTIIAGRLKVISTVGRGQSGIVYRVLDTRSHSFYAVKHFRFRAMTELFERLRQEAAITIKLAHPGIVRVCDLGVHLERPYLLYEFIDGRTFHSLLKQSPPIERALPILKQIAEALSHAHSMNVIHRDLKPKNILVDYNDQSKIADFGLAWAPGNKALTATGCSVGTPRFMSPEQLLGRSKGRDYKADVWSFGVMLYFSLTGSYPLSSKDLAEIRRQKSTTSLNIDIPSNSSIPKEVLQLCKNCLEADTEIRYASAQELLKDWP
ncbi:MAG: serine/threonine-protein kinase [Planctomycetota bacterium]|nr:serine/threonine-protein kinase [Planctomycetota bacterium]